MRDWCSSRRRLERGRAPACSTTCWSTTSRTRRSRPRRCCAALGADERRRGRRSRTPTSSRSRGRPGCRSTGSRPSRSPAPRASSCRRAYRSPRGPSCRRGWRRTPPRSTRRSRASCGASTSRTASPWGELAVIVRRQGTHLGNLLRALDDARHPARGARARASRSRWSRPPTRTCSRLRWLVADAAPARGADRAAADLRRGRAVAGGGARLDQAGQEHGPGAARRRCRPRSHRRAQPRGSVTGRTRARHAGQGRAVRGHVGAGRVQGAVGGAPLLRAAGRRRRPGARHGASRSRTSSPRRRSRATRACQAFLEALDAGEHGPGLERARGRRRRRRAGADRPRRRAASSSTPCWWPARPRATSRRCRGPSRCSTWLRCSVSAQPLRAGARAARGRAAAVPDGARARAPRGRARSPPTRTRTPTSSTQRSRFVDELAGVRVDGRRPRTGARRARERAARPSPRGAASSPIPGVDAWRRLAALDGPPRARRRRRRAGGSSATGPTPDGRCTRRSGCRTPGCPTSRTASCSTCSATSSGSAASAGYQAWVGKLVHGIIERIEKGELGKTKDEILAEVDKRWRDAGVPVEGRRRSPIARSSRRQMFKNWWFQYGEEESLANEEFFSFEFDDATIVGVIDRIGAFERRHAHHRLQDRQRRLRAEGRGEPAARHLLPGRPGVRGPRADTARCGRSSSPTSRATGGAAISSLKAWAGDADHERAVPDDGAPGASPPDREEEAS